MTHAVDFFDRQFRGQIAASAFDLNPFEQAALPYLCGDVLDLGCGLGNLALAAARGGCRVTARDGSATAIERLTDAAAAEGLPLAASRVDFTTDAIGGEYDCVVAIGLLMFFARPRSTDLLAAMMNATRPGGVAVVNTLIEGTTYFAIFGDGPFTLFGHDEIVQAFAGWEILHSSHADFAAPGDTLKRFATVIARKPA
jgi:tellurite methyltransferase